MLMRTDPFRELDRLTQQVFGTNGTLARPSVMPMDAWRDGDTFHVEFDLPGVNPDSIDLDVERNVVTVKAERPAARQRRRADRRRTPARGVQPAADPRRQPRHRAHRRQLRRRRAHPADPGRRAGQAPQDLHHQQGRGPAGHQRLNPAGTGHAHHTRHRRHRQRGHVDEQFLDLICADEDLLRAEFDAIIAAEWPSPPAGRARPRRRRRAARQRGRPARSRPCPRPRPPATTPRHRRMGAATLTPGRDTRPHDRQEGR